MGNPPYISIRIGRRLEIRIDRYRLFKTFVASPFISLAILGVVYAQEITNEVAPEVFMFFDLSWQDFIFGSVMAVGGYFFIGSKSEEREVKQLGLKFILTTIAGGLFFGYFLALSIDVWMKDIFPSAKIFAMALGGALGPRVLDFVLQKMGGRAE